MQIDGWSFYQLDSIDTDRTHTRGQSLGYREENLHVQAEEQESKGLLAPISLFLLVIRNKQGHHHCLSIFMV